MKTVYLAGPITEDADPRTWRENVAAQLPPGWQAIDPVKIEFALRNPREIVDTDLTAIEECDAVLALVDRPSWGTAMEIFYSHELGIPVIGWMPKPNGRPLSPWLTLHCNVIVRDFADAMTYLQKEKASA
jgi:nucleoside 2-deoxyribosyltransferase